jgi:hypothetical protein
MTADATKKLSGGGFKRPGPPRIHGNDGAKTKTKMEELN